MSLGIEKLISEWLAQEEKPHLPGKGKPLNLDDYFRAPPDRRVGHSILKNAGFVPEEVELLSDIGRLRAQIATSTDEQRRTELKRRLQEEQVRLNMQLERNRKQRAG
jgi:hypothetical protein